MITFRSTEFGSQKIISDDFTDQKRDSHSDP